MDISILSMSDAGMLPLIIATESTKGTVKDTYTKVDFLCYDT